MLLTPLAAKQDPGSGLISFNMVGNNKKTKRMVNRMQEALCQGLATCESRPITNCPVNDEFNNVNKRVSRESRETEPIP